MLSINEHNAKRVLQELEIIRSWEETGIRNVNPPPGPTPHYSMDPTKKVKKEGKPKKGGSYNTNPWTTY